MLFPTKINIKFGISTSNNARMSKNCAEKQVALYSLTFANSSTGKTVLDMVLVNWKRPKLTNNELK